MFRIDFNRRREPGDSFVVCSKDCLGSHNDPLNLKFILEVSDDLSSHNIYYSRVLGPQFLYLVCIRGIVSCSSTIFGQLQLLTASARRLMWELLFTFCFSVSIKFCSAAGCETGRKGKFIPVSRPGPGKTSEVAFNGMASLASDRTQTCTNAHKVSRAARSKAR